MRLARRSQYRTICSHGATVKIHEDQFSRGMPLHRLHACCTAMFASEDAQMLVSLLSSGALQLVPSKCSCQSKTSSARGDSDCAQMSGTKKIP